MDANGLINVKDLSKVFCVPSPVLEARAAKLKTLVVVHDNSQRKTFIAQRDFFSYKDYLLQPMAEDGWLIATEPVQSDEELVTMQAFFRKKRLASQCHTIVNSIMCDLVIPVMHAFDGFVYTLSSLESAYKLKGRLYAQVCRSRGKK